MTNITSVKQSELDVMLKASLFLRDKLLRNGRNGPLVKLLTREIDVFNDELDRRLSENPAIKTTNSSVSTDMFIASPQPKSVETPTAPLQYPASNGASQPTVKTPENKTQPARPKSAPTKKAKVSTTTQESSLLKRVKTDKS